MLQPHADVRARLRRPLRPHHRRPGSSRLSLILTGSSAAERRVYHADKLSDNDCATARPPAAGESGKKLPGDLTQECGRAAEELNESQSETSSTATVLGLPGAVILQAFRHRLSRCQS